MSGITFEQLQELTALINDRLDEFGGRLESITAGHVRLMLAAMEEWNEADEPRPEGSRPTSRDWQIGYEEGYAEAVRVAEYAASMNINPPALDPPPIA